MPEVCETSLTFARYIEFIAHFAALEAVCWREISRTTSIQFTDYYLKSLSIAEYTRFAAIEAVYCITEWCAVNRSHT
jgi:hypothetical protein